MLALNPGSPFWILSCSFGEKLDSITKNWLYRVREGMLLCRYEWSQARITVLKICSFFCMVSNCMTIHSFQWAIPDSCTSMEVKTWPYTRINSHSRSTLATYLGHALTQPEYETRSTHLPLAVYSTSMYADFIHIQSIQHCCYINTECLALLEQGWTSRSWQQWKINKY